MSEGFIRVSKEEYVVNALGLGLAIELLKKMADKVSTESYSLDEWSVYISEEANRKCDELSEEAKNNIVRAHEKVVQVNNGEVN